MAEPARDNPPKRDAPASDPNKPPSTQDQQSPTTLGATAPGQAQSPNVKIDTVAPGKVPVPQLGPASWSRTFPDPRTPAAVQFTQRGIDGLRDTKVRTGEWIVDTGKEKGTEKAIDKIIERLPFSEAIQGGVNDLSGQVQRFKALFQEKKKSAEEYVTGFFRVTSESIKCTASARIDCEKESAENVETVKNKYSDREGERWKPWMKEDVGTRKP